MKAVFIRHAQSFANAGLTSSGGFAGIPITAAGEEQARWLAGQLDRRPSLIVHSPFLRTQQTAAPTVARYVDVPVQSWPIQEFTNLDPSQWDDTAPADRIPHVRAFWERCDPEYCDGDKAESFSVFLGRVKETLSRLERLPDNSLVYLFSHGYFMNAVRSLVLNPKFNDLEHMQQFVAAFAAAPVLNVATMEMANSGSGWTIL